MLFKGRGGGEKYAVIVEEPLSVGIQRRSRGPAARGARDGEAAVELPLRARVHVPRVRARRAEQQRRREHYGYADRGQGHAARIELEAHDGRDAAGDVLAAVRDGARPRRAGVFRVRHAEQYASVFAPLLALEPLQHALVAEGLEVVAHAVEDVVHEGVAPVQRADEAPEDALRRVKILQVQQLVEQHLVVHAALRHGEHGPENAAGKGRGQALDLHGAARPQTVLFAHAGYLRRHRLRGGRAAPERQPQPRVGRELPEQIRRRAEGVGDKQPVRDALRRAGGPGQDAFGIHGVPRPGVGRGEAALRRRLAHVHPGGQGQQHLPRHARGDERAQGQQAPDAVLPAGRELVRQQVFHYEQHRRCQRDGERLQKELPDVPHGYTSISSSIRRSRAASSAEMCVSFKNAAMRSPAAPP